MLVSTDPLHGQLRYFADESLTKLHGAIDLRDLMPEHLRAPSASPDILTDRTLSSTAWSFGYANIYATV